MVDCAARDVPVLQSTIVMLFSVVLFELVLERWGIVVVLVTSQRRVGGAANVQLVAFLRLVRRIEKLRQVAELAILPPSRSDVGFAGNSLALDGAEVFIRDVVD